MSIIAKAKKVNSIFVQHDGMIKKSQSVWVNQNGVIMPVYGKNQKSYKIRWQSGGQCFANTSSGSTSSLYFYPSEVKKITLNGLVQALKTNTSISNSSYRFYVSGTLIGHTSASLIKDIAKVTYTKASYDTVFIENYTIDLDKDIDWSKWDREKPILFSYPIKTTYTTGQLNIEFSVVPKEEKKFSVQQFYSGAASNATYPCSDSLGIYNPQNLKNVKIDGNLAAYNQNGLFIESAYTKVNDYFRAIGYVAQPSAGSKLQLDTDYMPVDWETYNAEKGLFFTIKPTASSSNPGSIVATICYTISY